MSPAIGGADHEADRVLATLDNVIAWKTAHGLANVFVGEFGVPSSTAYADPDEDGAGVAAWIALARTYTRRAMANGLWLAYWVAGELFKGHKLAMFAIDDASTTAAPLSQERPQAALLHSSPSTRSRRFGVNLNGGEGSFPQIDATSPASNAREPAGSAFTFDHALDQTATGFGHAGLLYTKGWNYGSPESWAFLGSRRVKPGLVRLPFIMERVYRTLGGDLDATELGRLDAAIASAHANGLEVILDAHNFGRYYLDDGSHGVLHSIGGATVTSAHFADFWGKMAAHFAGTPGLLGYDLCNEPVEATNWQDVAQAALTAIRDAGDDTSIVFVATPGGSRAQDLGGIAPWISDPADRFMYEVHHYWDADTSSAYDDTYATLQATP